MADTLVSGIEYDVDTAWGRAEAIDWATGHLAQTVGASRRTAKARTRIVVTKRAGDAADSFTIKPIAGGLQVFAGDARGAVYALTELAERVRLATGDGDPLALEAAFSEAPSTRVRSVCRFFCSEEEDKRWFYDEQMWRDYLTMLASNRFTRFSIGFGLQYNYPYYNRLIEDVYFYFAYPFLVDVPGYDVRVHGLSAEERQRNLDMLRFIGREAARRGLEFQVALWTHGYDFHDVPRANYQITGIDRGNQAEYVRDALGTLMRQVPEITGLTIRVHVEGGVPEGSYPFWETVLSSLKDIGRPIALDVHAKGTDRRIMEIALSTGHKMTMSPKFMAEHTGLPYHQSAVRRREMPSDEAVGQIFKLSEGSRRFLRYGYGDLLASDRDYDVLVRVWPGTQRVLLSGDPAFAAAYARAARFCGASGMEFCEPLSFKGRMGSGRLGERFCYESEELRGRYDWSKFEYGYLLQGRLGYSTDAPRESWLRFLRATAGDAAEACEKALAHASRVLPLVTLAHGVSACNNTYWPEIYDNMSLVYPPTTYPYGYDSDSSTRFGDVPTFDPQLFANPRDTVAALWSGTRIEKYTALDVAMWLDALADECEAALRAVRVCADAHRSATRRYVVDAQIQASLARFFAARFRSACAHELYLIAGGRAAYDGAMNDYARARDAWVAIVNAAEGVYQTDLSYGPQPWLRGAWRDRLAGIDRDIQDFEFWYINDRDRPIVEQAKVAAQLAAMRSWKARPSVALAGAYPQRYARGKALTIAVRNPVKAGAAMLFFRHVHQGEIWSKTGMSADGQGFTATLPAVFTESNYPIQFYVVFDSGEGPIFAPGLGADLAGQPYIVIHPDDAKYC